MNLFSRKPMTIVSAADALPGRTAPESAKYMFSASHDAAR